MTIRTKLLFAAGALLFSGVLNAGTILIDQRAGLITGVGTGPTGADQSMLQDTRAMSRLLRPQILDDLGLEAAMHWLARSSLETRGLDVRLEFRAPPAALDGERATLVFRVAQEALANAARHAGATRVDVRFDGRADRVRLEVRDDGRGCDLEAALARGSAGASAGLGGMRDRARLFDGSLQLDSAPGAGFALVLELPLADSAAGAA